MPRKYVRVADRKNRSILDEMIDKALSNKNKKKPGRKSGQAYAVKKDDGNGHDLKGAWTIQKGVPLTEKRWSANVGPIGRAKDMFSVMSVGDSFFFPAKDKKNVRSAAISYGKSHDLKFAVRQETKNRARCWRLE
jgi:hypothetical protein